MKTKRAMMLVSTTQKASAWGDELLENLKEALEAYNCKMKWISPRLPMSDPRTSCPLSSFTPKRLCTDPSNRDARYLVEEHLYKGRVVTDLLAPPKQLTGQIGWLRARKGYNPAEQRIVLERAGRIDPENIEDYITHNGYEALGKALTEMTQSKSLKPSRNLACKGAAAQASPPGASGNLCARRRRRQEIRHLQRRRKRTRHLQRPHRPGRRPARHPRSDGNCRLRRRRGRRLHLHSRRVWSGLSPLQKAIEQARNLASWAKIFSTPISTSTSICTPARALMSAAKKPR
jgi:hypothetical protein